MIIGVDMKIISITVFIATIILSLKLFGKIPGLSTALKIGDNVGNKISKKL